MRNTHKIILISFLAVCSIVGFMVKLPKIFHHFDKELHTIFYFSATVIIAFLFPKRWIFLSTGLALFGIIIEFAQEYSNKISIRLIGKAIHGRFDIEDVKYNIIGLFIGVLFFHLIRITANFKKTI
jgi:VanZ family protein